MPYATINCKFVTVFTKESYYFKQFKINVIVIIYYTFNICNFIKIPLLFVELILHRHLMKTYK